MRAGIARTELPSIQPTRLRGPYPLCAAPCITVQIATMHRHSSNQQHSVCVLPQVGRRLHLSDTSLTELTLSANGQQLRSVQVLPEHPVSLQLRSTVKLG